MFMKHSIQHLQPYISTYVDIHLSSARCARGINCDMNIHDQLGQFVDQSVYTIRADRGVQDGEIESIYRLLVKCLYYSSIQLFIHKVFLLIENPFCQKQEATINDQQQWKKLMEHASGLHIFDDSQNEFPPLEFGGNEILSERNPLLSDLIGHQLLTKFSFRTAS